MYQSFLSQMEYTIDLAYQYRVFRICFVEAVWEKLKFLYGEFFDVFADFPGDQIRLVE